MASLKYILGPDNFTPFGNALLTDTTDMTNLPLSKINATLLTCKRHRVHLRPLFTLTSQLKT